MFLLLLGWSNLHFFVFMLFWGLANACAPCLGLGGGGGGGGVGCVPVSSRPMNHFLSVRHKNYR